MSESPLSLLIFRNFASKTKIDMIFKAYTDIRQELKKHHAFGIANADANERFRDSLEKLCPKFGIGESEEDEKTFVADFLKDAFYQGRNAIRVGAKHNIDCQIHVSSDNSSPVGVIIENKYSKSKAGEMVKDGDLLHKAFYETILYYLRLREAKNNSLRRIVITDMETWFIFDALDYNRIFYRSSLLKKYRDYAAGRVSDDSTAAFYAECEEFVKQTNVTLRYAYFNFRELAYTKKGDVRKNATDLYYLLSPYYLLKEDNDSLCDNSLKDEYTITTLHSLFSDYGISREKEFVFNRNCLGQLPCVSYYDEGKLHVVGVESVDWDYAYVIEGPYKKHEVFLSDIVPCDLKHIANNIISQSTF